MSIKRYYKAQEARRVLGNITAKKLKSYVDQGILHRVQPPGEKQEVYIASEVDAFAAERRAFWEGDSNGGTTDHPRRSRTAAR